VSLVNSLTFFEAEHKLIILIFVTRKIPISLPLGTYKNYVSNGKEWHLLFFLVIMNKYLAFR